ncbi:MAG TPA: amidohydrolase family protein [Solirubrobacteraceae bacterium]|nr:amidohydrolase family protein [Solirubrobacteraceae bacterium]
MPPRLPCLLSAPPAAEGRLWLTNATLFDGTGAPAHDAAAVLVEHGRIARVGRAGDPVPDGASEVDLDGRTLMPGLIDAHAHAYGTMPQPPLGTEPIRPGTERHFLAAALRDALRMGITTMRDVGSYGDQVFEARQSMRYGALRGPRLLTCGRIVSATSPGGRFFERMYREADGADDMRRAVREQVRRGADFIKVMTTGARTVELEDPDPAQLTREEITTLVDEVHRLGYRVAAHAEGLDGTELAVEAGIDTIEHGMYLNQRPELLERMAATGQVLVPTFGCFYGVAGLGDRIGFGDVDAEPAAPSADTPPPTWTHLLVDLAFHNLAEADRTLKAARAAGVPIATGHDWAPLSDLGLEILRMINHGLSTREALVASTATAAHALGLADHIGTITPGKLADLLVVDGDPLQQPALLRQRDRIWLVLQLGEPVAGAALENDVIRGPGVTSAQSPDNIVSPH